MPAHVTKSYEKFNYFLRPSKQVERKLFIEVLHHVRDAGYPIYSYTYIGLGSVFYADFIMFHKYLYIDTMTCLEWANIAKRMRFNKPFDFVTLKMRSVSEIVPELRKKTKYLVWLDYDRPLDSEMLTDIDGFMQVLAPGSIILITVEAEPRVDNADFEDLSAIRRDKEFLEYFRDEFGSLILPKIHPSDLTRNELPLLILRILRSQILKSLVSRPSLTFHQLFSFVYADGAQMFTLGGIIDHEQAQVQLRDAGVFDLPHVRTGQKVEVISVPPLTVREKEWIDSKLISGSRAAGRNFGLDARLLRNYIKFYKYYPTYYETLT